MYSAQHLAAFERWKRDGFSLKHLSEDDLSVLA
jgi:hypothetical protein